MFATQRYFQHILRNADGSHSAPAQNTNNENDKTGLSLRTPINNRRGRLSKLI